MKNIQIDTIQEIGEADLMATGMGSFSQTGSGGTRPTPTSSTQTTNLIKDLAKETGQSYTQVQQTVAEIYKEVEENADENGNVKPVSQQALSDAVRSRLGVSGMTRRGGVNTSGINTGSSSQDPYKNIDENSSKNSNSFLSSVLKTEYIVWAGIGVAVIAGIIIFKSVKKK